MADRRILRAAEIGEFVYCQRAWWLRAIQGHASTHGRAMAAGTAAHARHGRVVGLAGLLRGAAVLLVVAALLLWLFSR